MASGLATSSNVNPGPPRWAAPELLREDNARQTPESDIWSFSCLCYEVRDCRLITRNSGIDFSSQVLTRKLPFYNYSDLRVSALLATRYEIPSLPEPTELDDPEHDKVDPRMWAIMERCWKEGPAERPRCEMIQRDIAALNIQDDRPKVQKTPQNGLFFWQEMRANSGTGVDFGRVRNILLKASRILNEN